MASVESEGNEQGEDDNQHPEDAIDHRALASVVAHVGGATGFDKTEEEEVEVEHSAGQCQSIIMLFIPMH
jgi:hypothetical protein